jgi:hypothetical protein
VATERGGRNVRGFTTGDPTQPRRRLPPRDVTAGYDNFPKKEKEPPAHRAAMVADMADSTTRARAVVVGGGIAGVSVAYHLARAGWHDVVLLEKGELTSGSTHHAAGLVTQLHGSATMMGFRRYSVALYRELGAFHTVGSVRIASKGEFNGSAALAAPGAAEPERRLRTITVGGEDRRH